MRRGMAVPEFDRLEGWGAPAATGRVMLLVEARCQDAGPSNPCNETRAHMDQRRTAIPLAQACCLLPLMWFCVAMYRWEREDLVPIRPMEGEELPCDMLGPQSRKKIKDLHLPSLHLPDLRLPDALRKLGRTTSDGT